MRAVFPRAQQCFGRILSDMVEENYASRAAREAAATPTSNATMISTDAMVVAEEVSEAETVDMKERPAIMMIYAGRVVMALPIAIAIT